MAIQIQPFVPVGKNLSSSNAVIVGVSVITGYLGAGKSTFVNYILNGKHGKRIAVILIEFGEEIGVERAMINDGDGGAIVEEWVVLANGCVCCTIKHSLVQALEQLVQRKYRRDLILLETTCLAHDSSGGEENGVPLNSLVEADGDDDNYDDAVSNNRRKTKNNCLVISDGSGDDPEFDFLMTRKRKANSTINDLENHECDIKFNTKNHLMKKQQIVNKFSFFLNKVSSFLSIIKYCLKKQLRITPDEDSLSGVRRVF